MVKKLITVFAVLFSLIIAVFLINLLFNDQTNQEKDKNDEIVLKGSDTTEGIDSSEKSECEIIGDLCEGGILAYIDDSGKRLVLVKEDHPEMSQWGCRGQLLGITETFYGSGELNTQNIIDWHTGWEEPWYTAPDDVSGYCHEKNDGTVAAIICDDYEVDGYDDWYLPSIDELDVVYEGLHKEYKGDLELVEYWSSSEMSEGSSWVKMFKNGDEYGYQKTFSRSVRCVRSF